MKAILMRFVAVLLLVLPGLLAAYGFLEIKNVIYEYIVARGKGIPGANMDWGNLLWGLLCFAAGIYFIGGWIFFRDRKRNYLAPRFKKKQD